MLNMIERLACITLDEFTFPAVNVPRKHERHGFVVHNTLALDNYVRNKSVQRVWVRITVTHNRHRKLNTNIRRVRWKNLPQVFWLEYEPSKTVGPLLLVTVRFFTLALGRRVRKGRQTLNFSCLVQKILEVSKLVRALRSDVIMILRHQGSSA